MINGVVMANQEIDFDENDFIVSKTDLKGRITYGNTLFVEMSGFDENEILGKPHNVLRHIDMPRIIYKLLWDRVKSGNEIFAYVKNKSKNGDYYWVLAHVTPSFNDKNEITNYHSVRRKPTQKSLSIIIPLYQKLLSIEKSQGAEASMAHLNKLLAEKGVSYDEFILSI